MQLRLSSQLLMWTSPCWEGLGWPLLCGFLVSHVRPAATTLHWPRTKGHPDPLGRRICAGLGHLVRRSSSPRCLSLPKADLAGPWSPSRLCVCVGDASVSMVPREQPFPRDHAHTSCHQPQGTKASDIGARISMVLSPCPLPRRDSEAHARHRLAIRPQDCPQR